MNTALWIVQCLAALGFLAAGVFKLSQPKPALDEKMPWAKGFSATQVKLIGSAEILGAIGLIAPWATGILPVLTPIAASALAALMVGAIVTHVKLGEPPARSAPATINLLLAALVAMGRFGVFG